ncbi:hypothetical protein H5T51_00460 [Candidatus Bathyarchaeota archaeon]|nr:hypothetical protein [Candidatus Bathyarchaeota archaeon]
MKRRRVDLNFAKIVLAELERYGPLGRTQLEKRALIKDGSRATRARFDGILQFLKEHGYVEKASAERRAPYRITGKGRRFLEAL